MVRVRARAAIMLAMSQPPSAPQQFPPPEQYRGPPPGYPGYPIQPRRRIWRWQNLVAWLAGLAGIALFAGFMAVAMTQSSGPPDDPNAPYNYHPGGPAAPAATTAGFSQAEFDAYWQQWAHTSWGSLVTKIEQDGYGVTAHTKLFPDADARQPALSICGAISSFWAAPDRAQAPAVRVLDQADNILASRHTGEVSCSYRR